MYKSIVCPSWRQMAVFNNMLYEVCIGTAYYHYGLSKKVNFQVKDVQQIKNFFSCPDLYQVCGFQF